MRNNKHPSLNTNHNSRILILTLAVKKKPEPSQDVSCFEEMKLSSCETPGKVFWCSALCCWDTSYHLCHTAEMNNNNVTGYHHSLKFRDSAWQEMSETVLRLGESIILPQFRKQFFWSCMRDVNCPSIPLTFQWLCVTDLMLSHFCTSHNILVIFSVVCLNI